MHGAGALAGQGRAGQRENERLPVLGVDLDPEAAEVTVRVVGELDIGTRPQLLDALPSVHDALPAGATLVLDLAGLTFCDGAAVVELVHLVRMAEGRGPVVVRDPPRMLVVIADALRLELPAGTKPRVDPRPPS